MLNRGLDKQELLRIVDSVANEKSIDKELILSSMEMSIQRAAHKKFGFEICHWNVQGIASTIHQKGFPKRSSLLITWKRFLYSFFYMINIMDHAFIKTSFTNFNEMTFFL